MNIQKKQQIDSWLGYILIGIFLPITRLLGISLKRNHDLQPSPNAIIFLKLMGLGSLVISSEMMIAVKKKYPNTRIILITDANIGEGIQYFLSDIEIWKLQTSNLFRTFAQAFAYLVKSWRIKNLWVCDLEVYSKLTTIYSLLTCAKNRFGFILHPVQFRNYLNTHNIYYNVYNNNFDNHILMGQSMGLNTLDFNLEKTTNARPISPHFDQIVINNTCSSLSIYRKLPKYTILEIIQWIMQNTNYNISLVGMTVDFEENQSLISSDFLDSFGSRISNLSGKMSFDSYFSFLSSKAALMISIDSAPLHIAKKLGVPTLSIWGPTNPSHYLKISPSESHLHSTIYQNLPCSPCVHHTTKLPCGGNNVCMKEIPTETIKQELNLLLGRISQ